jgi:MFS-type transporter involved in bile tolerance (Atg22 family)
MITTEMVYWIITLDKIVGALAVVAGLLLLVLIAYATATFADRNDLHPVWFPFFCVVELILILGAVFTPTTKQMAAIYIIPKLANNERIQEIGDKTLGNGEKLLELTQKYIEKKIAKEIANKGM